MKNVLFVWEYFVFQWQFQAQIDGVWHNMTYEVIDILAIQENIAVILAQHTVKQHLTVFFRTEFIHGLQQFTSDITEIYLFSCNFLLNIEIHHFYFFFCQLSDQIQSRNSIQWIMVGQVSWFSIHILEFFRSVKINQCDNVDNLTNFVILPIICSQYCLIDLSGIVLVVLKPIIFTFNGCDMVHLSFHQDMIELFMVDVIRVLRPVLIDDQTAQLILLKYCSSIQLCLIDVLNHHSSYYGLSVHFSQLLDGELVQKCLGERDIRFVVGQHLQQILLIQSNFWIFLQMAQQTLLDQHIIRAIIEIIFSWRSIYITKSIILLVFSAVPLQVVRQVVLFHLLLPDVQEVVSSCLGLWLLLLSVHSLLVHSSTILLHLTESFTSLLFVQLVVCLVFLSKFIEVRFEIALLVFEDWAQMLLQISFVLFTLLWLSFSASASTIAS